MVPHSIHGTNGIFTYGKLVGKYTVRPMHAIGILVTWKPAQSVGFLLRLGLPCGLEGIARGPPVVDQPCGVHIIRAHKEAI